MNKEELIKKVLNNIDLGEHKLLYLTMYGSHLYGLDTPESDLDFRGIFLPSEKSLYLNNIPKEIRYNTKKDTTQKNSPDDIDVKLLSIHEFIKLCRTGDTGALDLLYSPSNKDTILFKDNSIDFIFNNPNRIIDLKTANCYTSYAISQAKKYGIKGSKLGVLKDIKQFIDDCDFGCHDVIKLSIIANTLVEKFGHKSYCFLKSEPNKDKRNEEYLVVCGSMHQLNIPIGEFYDRICLEESKYGHRTEQAQGNGGIDWKALSHALRVLYQCLELYYNGTITFPIKAREDVLKVKQGLIPYEEVEKTIIYMLENVDIAKEGSKYCDTFKYDEDFLLEEIRKLYE